MRSKLAYCSLLLLMLPGCHPSEDQHRFSFYHWKTDARFTDLTRKTLDDAGVTKLYVHYFDVDRVLSTSSGNEGVFPVGTLREVDEGFKQYDIVPVIFIANRVFENGLDIDDLSKRIYTLIESISTHHFGKLPEKIQLDCDWTESTREMYFNLITLQKKYYDVSITIRLHQVKYRTRTGVPPADHGTLMVYNIGQLDDPSQNSILESSIVTEYITDDTSYPIPLDVALPLFSQMVVQNLDGEIRLINHSDRASLLSQHKYFQQKGDNIFEVKADTLYKGLYLYKGYTIKLEEVDPDEVEQGWRIIRDSQIDTGQLIFYHLDDTILSRHEFTQLISRL